MASNLFPSMTLGCGIPAGNISSDNIGPQHLIHIKRLAPISQGFYNEHISGASPSVSPQSQPSRVSLYTWPEVRNKVNGPRVTRQGSDI